jgi:hypothetical protein
MAGEEACDGRFGKLAVLGNIVGGDRRAGRILSLLGEGQPLGAVSRRTCVFAVSSGLGTGVSWLCYFHALKLGEAGPHGRRGPGGATGLNPPLGNRRASIMQSAAYPEVPACPKPSP